MPPRFVVQGGRPLTGTVRPAGNKNVSATAQLLDNGNGVVMNLFS